MKSRRSRFWRGKGNDWAPRPSITTRLCFGNKDGHALLKMIPVFVILENVPAHNPPDHPGAGDPAYLILIILAWPFTRGSSSNP